MSGHKPSWNPRPVPHGAAGLVGVIKDMHDMQMNMKCAAHDIAKAQPVGGPRHPTIGPSHGPTIPWEETRYARAEKECDTWRKKQGMDNGGCSIC